MGERFEPAPEGSQELVKEDDARPRPKLRGLHKLLAERGYPLRRMRGNRMRGVERDEGGGSLELARVVSYSRILRGLPTRREFEAGLAVAEDWAAGDGLDVEVANRLADPGQRQAWRARIEEVQKLLHYRGLAAVAMQTELTRLPPDAPVPVTTGPPRRCGPRLGGGEGAAYRLFTTAPQGSRQSWRLSPTFYPREVEPPAPPETIPPVAPALTSDLVSEEAKPDGDPSADEGPADSASAAERTTPEPEAIATPELAPTAPAP